MLELELEPSVHSNLLTVLWLGDAVQNALW